MSGLIFNMLAADDFFFYLTTAGQKAKTGWFYLRIYNSFM